MLPFCAVGGTNVCGTGATARRLGLPSEHDFWSRGISACAICDGAAPIFADVPLGVVGGGDSAVEEAVYLTKYSPKVRLLVVFGYLLSFLPMLLVLWW